MEPLTLAIIDRLFPVRDSGLFVAITFLVLWLTYLLIQQPSDTILVPDSTGYLNFSPVRTSGYPLFLWLVGVEGVKVVQPVIAAFALLILYCASRKLFRSAAVSFALILVIAANFRFYHYHYTVFTESLYSSLLTLIIATYMRYARLPSANKTLALLSLLCGVTVTIRPSAVFLLPAILIGTMLVWNRTETGRSQLLILCIVPFLIVVGAEKQFHSAWHNDQPVSLFTRHAFAKAALIDAAVGKEENLYDKALRESFESTREFIWSAPGFHVRNHFLTHYEICIQYSCSKEHSLDLDSEYAKQSALKRIRLNIPGYLALTWHNFRSLWTIYPAATPGVTEKINGYIAQRKPIPYSKYLNWLEAEVREQGYIKFIVQVFVLIVGAASICVIAIGGYQWLRHRKLNAVFATTLFVSVCMQASQMVTALAGASVIRYTISLWPLFIVCLAGIWVLFVKRQAVRNP